MFDLRTVINLLGLPSIGLLSVLVPTYAVSVQFLGRETIGLLSELIIMQAAHFCPSTLILAASLSLFPFKAMCG